MSTVNDLALRILISAKDDSGPALGNARNRIQSISDQLKQLETAATRFLSFQIFSGWAQEAIRLSDSYKTLQGRLRIVSDNTQEYNKAQSELFAIAQRTRSSLEATYGVYGKLETAIKQLGGSQQQAIDTTETLNKAIALTSQGAAQDSAAILQFSQALGSGVLRGDEFNSVMENSPGLAQALANGLGVPISKLREMAEAGQLTADRLINALGKSAPKVAEQFAQLPVTVSGAMTQVNNAMQQYIGQSRLVNGVTTGISTALQGLASHFNAIATVVVSLSALLTGRLLQGWIQSAQASHAAAVAAREKAVADQLAQQAAQRALATEIQVAALRIKTAAATVEEARLYAAIVAGTEKETAAKRSLTAAINQLHAAEAKYQSLQKQMSATSASSAGKVGLLSGAFQKLGSAVNAVFALWAGWDMGQMLGNWLNQFEAVRKAGSYLAETLVLIQTGAQAMLDGISFSDRWAQIKQIHAEFEQMRAGDTTAASANAEAITQAEQQKAQATEQAALQQQQAFAKVQEATKALTAQIDADAKAQTAVLTQALNERIALIDASDKLDAVKDQLRAQAKLANAQAELQLQQAVAQQKLALIDQEYQAELLQAANNAQRLNDIETSKRQAKLSVYQGLAAFYQSEVDKLTQVWANETQAAAQGMQTLEALESQHQQNLRQINQLGMSEREKLYDDELAYKKIVAELKAEVAKGDQASQSKINELLADAKRLNSEITQEAIRSSGEQKANSSIVYDAKKRENEIYGLQKSIVEDNARAHQQAAEDIKQSIVSQKGSLEDVNATIRDITDKLSQNYLLQINADQASVAAFNGLIAQLTAPATKTIYIETVDQSGGAPAQASGGLAGIPTGQVWKFATGGYTRKKDLLPGFGGGDTIKALLEKGEFIVRKEAVQKLGVPTLMAINQGILPDTPIKRAFGGVVGDESQLKRLADYIKELQSKRQYLQTFNRNMTAVKMIENKSYDVTKLARTYTDILGLRNVKAAESMIEALRNVEINQYDVNNFNKLGAEGPKMYIRKLGDGLSEKINRIMESATKAKTNAPKPNLPDLLPPSTQNTQQTTTANNTGANTGTGNASTLPSPFSDQTAPSYQKSSSVVTVRFLSPQGAEASGQFSADSEVNRLLNVLKQAGARTA